ncbi:MAG: DUF5719 family protein [Actinomycetes bacterium]
MTGGGVIGALALVTGAAGLAAAASLLPDVPRQALDPVEVSVAEPARTLACPGPPVVPGSAGDRAVGAVGTGQDQAATDEQFRSAPTSTTFTTDLLASSGTSSRAAAAELPPAASEERREATLEAVGTVRRAHLSVPDAARLTATPSGRRPPGVAAIALASTAEGDLQGLAATSCAAPSAEAWVVGGGTTAGRSARLVLANPGPTAATVDVELFTTSGVLAPPAARGVVVPAGERRELLLEGLAPDEPALAVHVQATGGRVAAFVLDSALDGLVPKGVDVAAPAAAPSRSQTVPAVRMADDTASTLRLVSTGSRDAVVTWGLLGADGQATGQESVVTVPAGTVTDVDLGAAGVPPGLYTVAVQSDAPVAAAVQMVRTRQDGSGAADRAWSPSTSPLTPSAGTGAPSPALVALPAGASDVTTTLTVAAVDAPGSGDGGAQQEGLPAAVAEEASVLVRQVSADGSLSPPKELVVPAGTTRTVSGNDLAAPGSLGVQLTVQRGAVAAGLLLEQGTFLSAVPVHPPAEPMPQVAVRRVPTGAVP